MKILFNVFGALISLIFLVSASVHFLTNIGFLISEGYSSNSGTVTQVILSLLIMFFCIKNIIKPISYSILFEYIYFIYNSVYLAGALLHEKSKFIYFLKIPEEQISNEDLDLFTYDFYKNISKPFMEILSNSITLIKNEIAVSLFFFTVTSIFYFLRYKLSKK